jgi:hypothetical protein
VKKAKPSAKDIGEAVRGHVVDEIDDTAKKTMHKKKKKVAKK